ncbi:MAG: dephospho-CoA kinase [Campylobacterota bacterium]|nr:dephospho-CoA kinase [Campylobacterota bacterium]
MKNDTTINKEFNHAIALTGGIATGKSTVASLFMMHGFLTIDADKIAHKILDKNVSKITELFGEKYIKDNKVVRKELGNLIFNNEVEKKKLENFIHPLIKQQIIKEAKIFEEQKKPYLIDIPLFFENKNYDIKNSIVVYTPKDIQIERLRARDGSTKEDALSRINNQMDIEEKKLLANYIIDNSLNLKNLQNEVERIKKELLEKI